MNLYNENDFLKLCFKKKIFLVSFIVILCLIVIDFTLNLVFSKFENQTTFIVILSVSEIVLIFLSIYCFDMFKYFRVLMNEYDTILNGIKTNFSGTVIKSENVITTLSDSSRVYVITVKSNEEEKIFYLSEIFPNNIVVGQTYQFSVVFNYIEGYSNEN